jgi:hypothetical protein
LSITPPREPSPIKAVRMTPGHAVRPFAACGIRPRGCQ